MLDEKSTNYSGAMAAHTRRSATAWVAAAGCLLVALPPFASAQPDPAMKTPAMSCESVRSVTLAAPGTALTGAAAGTSAPAARGGGAPLPPHCRVDGVIDERTGSDGRPYAIGVAVNLPDRWNGRFLFQGGGGLNGSVNPPVGNVAAGASSALQRGFAVVSTDTGHRGSVFDNSFYADQEAALNFLFAAIPKVTAAAREIVYAF
jgi:feruloyl esterase